MKTKTHKKKTARAKATGAKTAPPRRRAAGDSAALRDADNAVAMLAEDHRKLKKLFLDFERLKENGGDRSFRAEMVRQACGLLSIHAAIEEEVFYPAVRRATGDDDLMDEAEVEHAGAKDLVAQLQAMEPEDELFDAKFTVLAEQVRHHIREEESKMFPEAEKSGLDLAKLGRDMSARKEELELESGRMSIDGLILISDIEERSGTRVI